MAQIPTGLLTRAQIIDHALRRAGNTKPSVRTDAITGLNQILYDLYTQFEWPFLNTTATVTLGSTFTLPSDFLQSQDDTGLQITIINGQPVRFPMHEVDRGQLEAQVPTTGTPLLWHADRLAGLGRVWPTPDAQAYVAMLRYKKLPPALTSDSDIPVFPWHSTLIQAVYVWALEYDSDPRSVQESGRYDMMLSRLRQTSSPLRSQSAVVPLDPQVFGPVYDPDIGAY